MHIILIYIIFNIAPPQDYGKADYIFDVVEYNAEISGDQISLDDIDGITSGVEYYKLLSNLSTNVDVYKYVMPLRLFLYQSIRAPPVMV